MKRIVVCFLFFYNYSCITCPCAGQLTPDSPPFFSEEFLQKKEDHTITDVSNPQEK